MDSRDLTPDQLIEIRRAIAKHLPTLKSISAALDRRVPGSDVATAARDAYTAARALFVKVHYASCTEPLAKPFRQFPAPTASGAFAAWAG